MNYFDIVNKAIELVVVDAGNGLSFLEPRYKEILREAGLTEHEESIDPEELFEVVKLEVEKRNAFGNTMNVIASWITDVITEVINPAIVQEENEFMKNMLAYLERDKDLKQREEKIEEKEKELDVKEQVGKIVPAGINLSKRKAED